MEADELNIAYNIDCMEYMRTLPDKAFDLAVVDPPYFSGPEKRGYYGSKESKIGVHRDYPISPDWEVPGFDYFAELVRVSKKYIAWGCNYFDVLAWQDCVGQVQQRKQLFRLRDRGDELPRERSAFPVYVERDDARQKHIRRPHNAGQQETE